MASLNIGVWQSDILRAAALAAAIAIHGAASAQAWPAKPLRIIVPFPPAGGADIVVRQMAPRLSDRFGQQVVVENRPGAGGNIGAELIAKAAPDGYTVGVLTTAVLAFNPSLDVKLAYDPVKDFRPVTLLANIPYFFVANPSVPANSMRDVIALAKGSPGKFAYGHSGNGTLAHLSGELLKMMTGVDIVAVPYKGGAPAAMDVVGGQLAFGIVELPAAQPQIRAGKLKALGVTTARRIAAAPDVPTISESGVPGFDTLGWFGVVAPAGTPVEVVSRWNAEIVGALNVPETRDRLAAMGAEPAPSSIADFDAFIKSEIVKWARVVRSGVKMND
jgi:tripartite-type tricarboxylate transporter receptor subunit TctC